MFNPLDQNGDMTADYMLYSTSVVITQKKKVWKFYINCEKHRRIAALRGSRDSGEGWQVTSSGRRVI